MILYKIHTCTCWWCNLQVTSLFYIIEGNYMVKCVTYLRCNMFHMYNKCVYLIYVHEYYICSIHLYFTCNNTCVGYTAVLHVWNMCITCILYMYYRCINCMCKTSKNTTRVYMTVYYTYNTHVAHFLVYYTCGTFPSVI